MVAFQAKKKEKDHLLVINTKQQITTDDSLFLSQQQI
jgi:hypothetical protein